MVERDSMLATVASGIWGIWDAGRRPVVPFDIPELNVEDFIRGAFRRISIRLVAQLFRDQVLAITEPNSPEERGA
jgi:hypothetical protein